MKISAIRKPVQSVSKNFSKPRKALLGAIAATTLALTPMTTLKAQDTNTVKTAVEKTTTEKSTIISLICGYLAGLTTAGGIGIITHKSKTNKNDLST